jgi:hypothetical protein
MARVGLRMRVGLRLGVRLVGLDNGAVCAVCAYCLGYRSCRVIACILGRNTGLFRRGLRLLGGLLLCFRLGTGRYTIPRSVVSMLISK